jgi:hypothetical protein
MTRITLRDTRTVERATDWRDNAVCRELDPEIFFATNLTHTGATHVEEARTACRRCPSQPDCLAFALGQHIGDGIYGGLTEDERRNLKRSIRRGNTDLEQAAATARTPRPPKPRTLAEYYNLNTRSEGDHRLWTGTTDAYYGGRQYTPRQLAFTVDRGHYPVGRVITACLLPGCVLAAHLTDQEERGTCGTRNGYQWHRRRGEGACQPCRQANTDADNRLRRTGTSKVPA